MKKTNSLILIANGKHVLKDSWTSFGVVIGVLLTWKSKWLYIYPIIAIIVANNILLSSGKLIRQSVSGLMDEVDNEYGKTIQSILAAEIVQRECKFTRIKFYILFPKGTLLEDAQEVATQIE